MSPEIQITKKIYSVVAIFQFLEIHNTEIQITDLHKYKLQKYRNKMTEAQKYK